MESFDYPYWSGRLSAALQIALSNADAGIPISQSSRACLAEYDDKLRDYLDELHGGPVEFEPTGNSCLHPSHRP